MATEITELKCRDCQHFVLAGWWESLDILGISEKLIEPNYYAITNSKVLEIKQNDKEILSPIFEQFIPLWQQHIKTMNVLENQLFYEFRDALLPALMSGRLSLENKTDIGNEN